MQEIQQKIKEVQKENEDMQSKLSKKERECEAKTEEKVTRSHSFAWLHTVLTCISNIFLLLNSIVNNRLFQIVFYYPNIKTHVFKARISLKEEITSAIRPISKLRAPVKATVAVRLVGSPSSPESALE